MPRCQRSCLNVFSFLVDSTFGLSVLASCLLWILTKTDLSGWITAFWKKVWLVTMYSSIASTFGCVDLAASQEPLLPWCENGLLAFETYPETYPDIYLETYMRHGRSNLWHRDKWLRLSLRGKRVNGARERRRVGGWGHCVQRNKKPIQKQTNLLHKDVQKSSNRLISVPISVEK